MLNNWQAVSTLDRLFDDVMGSTVGAATSPRAFAPLVDVRTTDRGVTLVCDVPGVKREDLDIQLTDHVLTIAGARRFDGSEGQGQHVLLGRAYGSFTRKFALPNNLDEDSVTADLADGVLTIRIAKHEKAQPRKIAIGAASSAGEAPTLTE